MRPPRISTDTFATSLMEPRRERRLRGAPGRWQLLASRRHLDDRRLVVLAVHVDALDVVLQVLHRSLRELRVVGLRRRRLLDHLVLQRNRCRRLERCRAHDADALIVWPDELVDLVHLPRLMALAER